MFRFLIVFCFVFCTGNALAQPRGSSKPVTGVDRKGNVTFQCTEVLGKLTGNCTVFFPDGKKNADQVYVNGKQSGAFKLYHEDGETLKSTCGYVNGKCVGHQFNYYPDGKTIEAHFFYDNNGLMHGSQFDWWENGNLRVLALWDHGTLLNTKVYLEDGTLEEEWNGNGSE